MGALRVAGGELKGRRLAAPRKGSPELRPTTARVREAVFSILGDIGGARVLDLCCGTGALGIEALSRGAERAVLVDTDPECARANVEGLGLAGRAEVVRSDAVSYLECAGEGRFDLILCDPPYRLADRLAGALDPLLGAALSAGGRFVSESSADNPIELHLPLLRRRRYGDTLVSVYGGASDG